MRLNLAFSKAQEANQTHIQRRNNIRNQQRHTEPYEVGDRVYIKTQASTVGVNSEVDGNWVLLEL